jgi:predicted nucleotidyltransferase
MKTRPFLACLNAHDVSYVVIGALALPRHGVTRATVDIDVFVDASTENLRRTLSALLDFGYDVTEVSIDDLRKYKLLIRDYDTPVDVHPHVKGATFEEVLRRSEQTALDGVPFRVPSFDDLVAMKRAAGRPKDLEDLKMLEAAHAALEKVSEKVT